MIRLLLSGGLFFSSLPVSAAPSGPTHLRKQHTLVIEARAGKTVTVELTAIRASLGYPDPLVFRLYGPDGKSAAQGRLPPGETKILTLTPAVDGFYLCEGNPGMNAFRADIRGAAWVVDLGRTRQLNVIGHARPLYFFVPPKKNLLTLRFSGEHAGLKLLRPDGTVAVVRDLPQYRPVTVTTPVPAGQGGWWCMELSLAEDQSITFPEGIPPLVAEAPLSRSLLRSLTTGSLLVDFDLHPTPRHQLTAAPGRPKWTWGTKDGLALEFSGSGRLLGVNCDGEELVTGRPRPLLGFFVRDAAEESDLVPLTGAVRRRKDGWRIQYTNTPLHLSAEVVFRPANDHVSVETTVRNEAKSDRAVTLYFALPFPQGAPVWWDDILTGRPATGNRTLGAFASVSAGANGLHSVYPFACVSGRQALALALPMDYPLCHRFAVCPATRQFFLAVDLGLTRATAEFPDRASFRFVLYRCDPRWGFRSAAAHYYRLFPRFFEKRMTEDGGWVCWGTCAGMTNLAELGFKYHWGPGGPEAVKFDDSHGLYSFLYTDSARYFADLGRFDHRPTPAEATAAMQRLLDAPDPRAVILSARRSASGRLRYLSREKSLGRPEAERWLVDSVAAVRRSAALDGKGRIQVGYLVNRKDWGGEDWWTGRVFCNLDPDLPGGYGRFLFDRVLTPATAGYRKHGAEVDGFGLDNFFTNAATLDFSRRHLAFTDYPAAFATGDFRPVIIGDTCMYEWVKELKQRLEAEGKWLMANTGSQPFPFAQHLLDVNGLEWGVERAGPAARTLAYHKQVVTLPVQPAHYREPFLQQHLSMAAFPGGYGNGRPFRPGTETARLYAKYVPLIHRMSAAGWEPVPWAVADKGTVSIERFGVHEPLLFSLHNRSDAPATTRVAVDLAALHAPTLRRVRDLVAGTDLAAATQGDTLAFSVSLQPHQVTVVEVR